MKNFNVCITTDNNSGNLTLFYSNLDQTSDLLFLFIFDWSIERTIEVKGKELLMNLSVISDGTKIILSLCLLFSIVYQQ